MSRSEEGSDAPLWSTRKGLEKTSALLQGFVVPSLVSQRITKT